MKTNFRLLILICALPLVGNAQSRDSFLFLGNAFDADWNKGSIKLSGDFVAGSNALNTRLFNDVLFRATFTESAKQQFLDGSAIKNNIYAECGKEFGSREGSIVIIVRALYRLTTSA